MTNPAPATVLAAVNARRPDPNDAQAVSRWMLGVLGAFHSPAYRIDAVLEGMQALGLGAPDKTVMPTPHYVAQRAAPLGPVGAVPVASAFYGFSPQAIARAHNGIWDATTPKQVIETVIAGVSGFYAPLFAHEKDAVSTALGVLRPVAAAQETAGRPLAAAWSTVDWTGDLFADFWLATTHVRESRGDAHIAALVTEQFGPAECHFLARGDHPDIRTNLMTFRGWSDAELDDAVQRLHQRSILDASGQRTDAGVAVHAHIEQVTDRASSSAWAALDEATVTTLSDALMSLLEAVLVADVIPAPAYARLMPPA
jgi:hypothetical protein